MNLIHRYSNIIQMEETEARPSVLKHYTKLQQNRAALDGVLVKLVSGTLLHDGYTGLVYISDFSYRTSSCSSLIC